jgi:hypothetical protein
MNPEEIAQAISQMKALMAQEGDLKEFEHVGYHCIVLRSPKSGFLSGFVGVPPTHPYYEIDHDTIEDVQVHGGLQFSGPQIDQGRERPNLWYFGFDCHQFDDLCLEDLTTMTAISYGLKRSASYKSMPYVEGQVRGLAEQLKACEHKRVYH